MQLVVLLTHSSRPLHVIMALRTVCIESARSPCDCTGYLQTLRLPHTSLKYLGGGLIGLIGYH